MWYMVSKTFFQARNLTPESLKTSLANPKPHCTQPQYRRRKMYQYNYLWAPEGKYTILGPKTLSLAILKCLLSLTQLKYYCY